LIIVARYEFTCEGCGLGVELDRTMGDSEPPDCMCGDRMRRVYHSVPIKFNSSGFYSTGG
jgi:putative FmdB family regulatory protein